MPIRADDLRPEGAKIRVSIAKDGEVAIVANRLGLKALSDICAALSESVGSTGNHYHLMDCEGFGGTEPGSVSLVIYGED